LHSIGFPIRRRLVQNSKGFLREKEGGKRRLTKRKRRLDYRAIKAKGVSERWQDAENPLRPVPGFLLNSISLFLARRNEL
jgi:hypothetical protein